MKTLLISIALSFLTSVSKAQSISEVNFLKLFEYATENSAKKINNALKYLSPNWQLNTAQSESGKKLKWEYKLSTSSSPSAEFYLAALTTDKNVEFNKIAYVFLSEALFKRYISSVADLDDCEIVYSNIEKGGEKKTIYQNPHTVFIFREIPINRIVEGKTLYKSYSIEMHPSFD